MKSVASFTSLLASLVLLAVASAGCATSKSYQRGVADLYPVAADRMEKYAMSDEALPPKIEALRDAAEAPVTYPQASAAWRDAEPDYRLHVAGDAELSEFVRSEYLITADKLDELNAAEARRRSLFFLPP